MPKQEKAVYVRIFRVDRCLYQRALFWAAVTTKDTRVSNGR